VLVHFSDYASETPIFLALNLIDLLGSLLMRSRRTSASTMSAVSLRSCELFCFSQNHQGSHQQCAHPISFRCRKLCSFGFVELHDLFCRLPVAKYADSNDSRLPLLVHGCCDDAINCSADTSRQYRMFGLERKLHGRHLNIKCSESIPDLSFAPWTPQS
jgi:hypothetical protein